MKKIIVKGIEISTEIINNEYYLSLTDIAKKKSLAEPRNVISSWLSSINTINFLACWEEINNPSFNKLAFRSIEDEKERLFLTPEDWINRTNSIGLISKSGYLGDVYANSSIAFEFAHWISLEFKLHLIKEYQNLNIDTPKISLNPPNNAVKEIDTTTHNNAVKEIDTTTHNGSLDKLENQSKNTDVETKVEPSDLKSSIESKFYDDKPSTLKMMSNLFFLSGNGWVRYGLFVVSSLYNSLMLSFIGNTDFTLVDAVPIVSLFLFISIVSSSIILNITYYFSCKYIDKHLYPYFDDIKKMRIKMGCISSIISIIATLIAFGLFNTNPDTSYDLLYGLAMGHACYSSLYFFHYTDKEYIYYKSLSTKDGYNISDHLFSRRIASFLLVTIVYFILFLIFYSAQLTAIYG